MSRARTSLIAMACAVAALATPGARAQPAPFAQIEVPASLDSGLITNSTSTRGVIFTTIVSAPGAPWIRLSFDHAALGAAPPGGQPTTLVLTSLLDGATQHHRAVTLQQWHNTSAYFNGDSVQLQVIADPGAQPSRVALSSVIAGAAALGNNGICGPTDDRLPSSDPRVARGAPNGCTAFMISDYSNCFLSAGHCNLNFALVEFNVPFSDPVGILVHPGPQDQYVLDQSSIQLSNGGIGNDWMYFGCFANTETDLTPFEAQGAAFDLSAAPPPAAGQAIRVTGYGVDFTPPDWNQVQQSATGPFQAFFGSTLQFRVDAQGGNSGSPLIDEGNGQAIGILTHGGCIDNAGANNGTGGNNTGLQLALSNPLGVCLPAPPVSFAFPNGIPGTIDPDGRPIRVVVSGANGGTPQPGTGVLHVDSGIGFVAVSMAQVEANVYDAVFPPLECFLPISYYFSAQATTGESVRNPLLPGEQYTALVATGIEHAELLASDGTSGDSLGISVAVSGGLAVVGAFNDSASGPGSGSAYVFRQEGAVWVQVEKLVPSDGGPGDAFGYAVAINGDVIVVGALGDGDNGNGAGAAYVFRLKDFSAWMQEQKLLALDGAPGDAFGISVATDGSTALIGAYADDDRGNGAGSAYVFHYDGGAWVQQAKLLAGDGAEGDAFGNAVDLDGDRAIVGASSGDVDFTDAGSAYVFRREGSTWTPEQKLIASDGAESDFLGYAVALSGNVAMLGARGADDPLPGAGAVYEFTFDGATWRQGQKLLAAGGAAGDGFGGAVSSSAGAVVIGAANASPSGAGSGAAYVFRHNGLAWVQAQTLLAPQGAAGDAFGISVAADGGTAVVGAWHDDAGAIDSGSAEVFAVQCVACPQDIDRDGVVDVRDFLALLGAWGTNPGGPPDLDGDGIIDQRDLEALLGAWGPCG